MDALNTKELIGEVAKRHGVLLGPTDPVLVTVTLNELVVGRLIEQVTVRMEAASNDFSAAAVQQRQAAAESASALITEAAQYMAEQARQVGDELAARIAERIARETNAARADAQKAAAAARTIKTSVMYAAGTAIAAAALAIGLVLGRAVTP